MALEIINDFSLIGLALIDAQAYYLNMSSYSCCDKPFDTADILPLSSLLKLIGEESRLRLLSILRDYGEHCVCELSEHATGLSQSLISHHLSDLKAAGLIESKKNGLRVYYSLTNKGSAILSELFNISDQAKEVTR